LDFENFKADGGSSGEKKPAQEVKTGAGATKRSGGGETKKGETLLGIDIKKEDDFSGWYTQVRLLL